MKTKKSNTKPNFRQQILWFIGLYVVSVLAMSLFHEMTKWLITVLK